MNNNHQRVVISLGGSLIVPDKLDLAFLKKFRSIILAWVKRGRQFGIVTGGGALSRCYNQAAKRLSTVSKRDLDWVGIATTRLNGELVRSLFGHHAQAGLYIGEDRVPPLTKPILVAGGWRPGHSTDLVAVEIAAQWGVRTIINLSNTSHVFDADPKRKRRAKPIESLSWLDYLSLIPKRWTPRLSCPFDPIASRLARRKGIKVAFLNGRDATQLNRVIAGDKFSGTIIG